MDGTATITVPLTTRRGRAAPGRTRARSPLPWFLGLSVLVHGVVIGSLWWPDEVPVHTPGGTTLTVTLQTERAAPARPAAATPAPPSRPAPPRQLTARAEPAAVPRPAPKATPRLPSRDIPAPAAAPAPAPAAARVASPHDTMETASSAVQELEHAEARIGASVREALHAHFTYPLLARRRGWAGRVQLSLRVESDGRLSHVRVLQSSGYGLLDRAALTSVRAIGIVPQALRWLHGHHFDMVLPVEYRLLDG